MIRAVVPREDLDEGGTELAQEEEVNDWVRQVALCSIPRSQLSAVLLEEAQDVGLGLPSHTQAGVTPQDRHSYLGALLEGLVVGGMREKR